MGKAHAMAPTLEVIRGGRTLRVVEVGGAGLHIGRGAGHEVHFDDTKVSRDHARLDRRLDGSCFLVDLESRNQTFVNGQLLVPFEPFPLHDGSRIKIVDIEIIFRDHPVEMLEGEKDRTIVLGSIDDMSSQTLATRSLQPSVSFQAVLDVSRALGGADLDEVLGRVLDGLMAVFPRAERGFVLSAEPDETLPLRAVRYRHGVGQAPSLSRSISWQVLQEGRAVLISDASSDARFKDQESVALCVRTALCVPLPGHGGRPVGMVQLDSLGNHGAFTASDLDLMAALAVPIGVALENHRLLKLQATMEAAREIQLALLPKGRPEVPGYGFWECYRPASKVGGDLYDYIKVEVSEADEERWTVTVGDVAGKGMPAALLMASICPEVRHLVRAGVRLPEVLARVNRHVCESGIDARFVTMVMAEIDRISHRITIVDAGHTVPLIRRMGGRVEQVVSEGKGSPLGVLEDEEYGSIVVSLGVGDVVVLYSDGVTEAVDGAGVPYGTARLVEAIKGATGGVESVGETILESVREHTAAISQYDDITIVCFGRNGQE